MSWRLDTGWGGNYGQREGMLLFSRVSAAGCVRRKEWQSAPAVGCSVARSFLQIRSQSLRSRLTTFRLRAEHSRHSVVQAAPGIPTNVTMGIDSSSTSLI